MTLSNRHGVSAKVVAWGAMLQSLIMPDRHGTRTDVLLSYPTMAGYLAQPQDFGATVGRYANRIAGASFTLDGHIYSLPKNDGANTLHGGPDGFSAQLWTLTATKSGPVAEATFTRVSPDGEEGFPGTLQVSVTYALDENGVLGIRYTATTDKPTVINLTNHSYFNLAGISAGGEALDQLLTVAADTYLPAGPGLIPTGEVRPVAGHRSTSARPTGSASGCATRPTRRSPWPTAMTRISCCAAASPLSRASPLAWLIRSADG